MTTVTCLIDDAPSGHKALVNQHGLSFHVTTANGAILFDCGSTGSLVQNARYLGLDLSKVHTVVLSHAHYDHTGGFRAVADVAAVRKLVTGRDFFLPKYSLSGLRHSYMGPNFDVGFLTERGMEHTACGDQLQLSEDSWIIGNFERINACETIPDRYALKTADGFVPDPFNEEVSLAVRMDDGVALFVGCSHPGLLNMIHTTEKRLNLPVRGIWGGTHLIEAPRERIDFTLDAVRWKGIRNLGFSHCSGECVQEMIRNDPFFAASPLRPGDGVTL